MTFVKTRECDCCGKAWGESNSRLIHLERVATGTDLDFCDWECVKRYIEGHQRGILRSALA